MAIGYQRQQLRNLNQESQLVDRHLLDKGGKVLLAARRHDPGDVLPLRPIH